MSMMDNFRRSFGLGSGAKPNVDPNDTAAPGGLDLSPDGGAKATTLNKKPILIAGVVLCAAAGTVYFGFEGLNHVKVESGGQKLVPGRSPDISIPPPKPKAAASVVSVRKPNPEWANVVKPTGPQQQTNTTQTPQKKQSAQDKAVQTALSQNMSLSWSNAGGTKAAPNPNVSNSAPAKSDGEAGAGVYDAHLVRRPASPYEIMAGNVIPAVLTTSIQSDLPGQISAMVSRNVYDSESGAYLLIPAGSKLVGIYSNKVIAGQTRVGVDWTRIIFPNGSYVSIGKMPGTGPGGKDGMHDLVNDHTWEIFKNALLMSVVDLGISVSQPGYASAGGYGQQAITPAQTGEQSLAQTFGQAEAGILQKYTSIAPTLIIRSGYQLNVAVTKDIVFPSPYNPKPAALPQAPGGLAPAAVSNPYPAN